MACCGFLFPANRISIAQTNYAIPFLELSWQLFEKMIWYKNSHFIVTILLKMLRASAARIKINIKIVFK